MTNPARPESSAPRSVYFCAGKFCPGYHWPASNFGHPTSCAIERLNSVENLAYAARSRRDHGRDVSWELCSGTDEERR